MFKVTHKYGNEDCDLAVWFGKESRAKEYAEALKDTSDSYTITFVPKNQMSPWDAWFTVIED
jgi:hypothetical protein